MSIRAASFQRSTRKELAGSLRQFLRYLHRQGFLIRDLAPALTSPSLYALESIPAALRPEEVSAVLQITEKDRTPIGLRDFAILTLLSTYGLRAGEVIGLRLEDVDWRHDRLRVHRSKTGGETLLALLAPVGSAILRYLRHGRPETAAREVFIHAQAPYRAFRNASSLYVLIARRLKAAGVHPQGRQGSHAFRHARAVSLLRASVPMKTIGDILGHQRSSSTAIYLKLASSDLRSVSLEVPKEVTP
jgi:site-specific recombinase XerD